MLHIEFKGIENNELHYENQFNIVTNRKPLELELEIMSFGATSGIYYL
jgi:hypothetical protein